MSEDTAGTGHPGPGRGERRRALQAERERQAQRERPDEPPPQPPLVRPYTPPHGGQEAAAVLVADAPETSGSQAPAGAWAADDDRPPRVDSHPAPDADAEPPGLTVDVGSPAPAVDADAPAPFVDVDPRPPFVDVDRPAPSVDADAPAPFVDVAPPAPLVDVERPRRFASLERPAPFVDPYAPASADQSPGWSAFTPVIPPEPLRFEDTPASSWEAPEPWTAPVTAAPGDSWMTSPLSLEPAEPDVAVEPSGAPGEGTAWTVPTPEQGLQVDPPARPAPDLRAEPDEDISTARDDTTRPDEQEDIRPLTPPLGWSTDLSRVGLFRSALEELAHTPGRGVGPDEAQPDVPLEPPVDEPGVDELPVDETPDDDLPVEKTPDDERANDGLPTGELPAHDERADDGLSTGELPAHDEVAQDESSRAGFGGAEPADDELPTGELPVDEPADRQFRLHQLSPENEWAPGEWAPDEPATGELAELPREEVAEESPQSDTDTDTDTDTDNDTDTGAPHDEQPHDESVARDVPPALSAPLPPAPPVAVPRSGDGDASLPPSVARPGFGRAPAQRLAEALAQGEGPERPDDEEPLRGTLAPVLRRSTERVRYPTSTMPVIRPPVMPPTPGAGISLAPAQSRPVSWEQAVGSDVVPQGTKKQRRRGRRMSKPRHESGGFGEYRPKVSADRSLTVLVVAMLLVLAGLVAAAVWTFWPRVSSTGGSSPVLGAPRAVGGP